jgi:ubiquinone/menaquinone biosynthesis C-methylase UbiE
MLQHDVSDERRRLQTEYAHRDRRLAGSDVYSPLNVANLFAIHQRQRATVGLLRRHGITSLSGKNILEVGCGRGGVLLEYRSLGATAGCVHGVDLIFDRLRGAVQVLPDLKLVCADGQDLPFPAGTFDLVLQYTALSSLLSDQVKDRVAREMLRVVHQPGGLIVWYDFWLNPSNPQTRGIRPAEIRRLFPSCQLEFTRVTLAPPIARRLVPISWLVSQGLESVGLANSHHLVAIEPGP